MRFVTILLGMTQTVVLTFAFRLMGITVPMSLPMTHALQSVEIQNEWPGRTVMMGIKMMILGVQAIAKGKLMGGIVQEGRLHKQIPAIQNVMMDTLQEMKFVIMPLEMMQMDVQILAFRLMGMIVPESLLVTLALLCVEIINESLEKSVMMETRMIIEDVPAIAKERF